MSVFNHLAEIEITADLSSINSNDHSLGFHWRARNVSIHQSDNMDYIPFSLNVRSNDNRLAQYSINDSLIVTLFS